MPKVSKAKSPNLAPYPANQVTVATVEYDFRGGPAGNPPNWVFTMGPATQNPSNNPAPITGNCLYIIYNHNENTTYVGYAADANNRWSTRAETFHCFGISTNYANNVHCAICEPVLQLSNNNLTLNTQALLKGAQKAEHLLMRSVVNGELGATTCTNTQDATTRFSPNNSFIKTLRHRTAAPNEAIEVQVFLPASMTNGHLRSWSFKLKSHTGY